MANNNNMMIGVVIVVIVVAIGAYLVLGTQSNAPSGTPSVATTVVTNTTSPTGNQTTSFSVNVQYNSSVGNYLVNSSGWTLYQYTKDVQNSANSSCFGTCSSFWPPFYAGSNPIVAASLNSSQFGTITGSNGKPQTTYQGWPLYLYTGDKAPGQLSGQGVGGFYVMTTPKPEYG